MPDDKEVKKRVENFAVHTIKEVDAQSKMLNTTLGQIAKADQVRKKYRYKYW